MISVIMPVYNAGKTVRETIKSILDQSYRDLEYIIVDDCSTDATQAIINSFSDKRIIYIRNNTRFGVAKSLNIGLQNAHGKFIARIDADDIADTDRLKTQVTHLNKHKNCGIIGSWVHIIDMKSTMIGVKKYPVSPDNISLLFSNPINHSTVVFRRILYDMYGGYDENLNGAEDYELWIRYARYTTIANIGRPLLQYRINPKGVSKSQTKNIELQRVKTHIKAIIAYRQLQYMVALPKSVVSWFMPVQIKKVFMHMSNNVEKWFAVLLKQSALLSALSCRLVQITRKHPDPIHPKHLVKIRPVWYLSYIKKTNTVLDIGCNNGQHTLKIASKCKKIYGFDYDKSMLQLAKREAIRKNISNAFFTYGNAEKKYPFPANSFDVVVFLDVYEHLTKRKYALKQVHRVLKRGGILLISVPKSDTSWKRTQKKYNINYFSDPDHKIEFTKREIKVELEQTGFKVTHIFPVTLDTPLVGFIDIIGGISLSLYQKLKLWRRNQAISHPEESIGMEIVAIKK